MVNLTRHLLRMASQTGPKDFYRSKNMKEFWYYSSGFHKYGLMRDDMRRECPIVTEALRRLPQHLRDERNFRIIRAMLINSRHSILPQDQWMTIENDVQYLKPYVDEVEEEIKEKEEWNKE